MTNRTAQRDPCLEGISALRQEIRSPRVKLRVTNLVPSPLKPAWSLSCHTSRCRGGQGDGTGPPRVASSLLLPPPQPEAPPLPRPRSPRGLSPRSGELPATERPKAQNTSSGAKLLAVSLPLVWLGDVAWPSELRTPLPFPPKAPLTTTGAGGPVSTIGC